eukprot:2589328-Ditylum_brightwellii.AAC.1
MDKEGFNRSSSTLKDFTKTFIHQKECKPKRTEVTRTACKSHSKIEGTHNAQHKANKKAYRKWGRDSPQSHSDGRGRQYCKYNVYCNHTMDEYRITINWCKGHMCHEEEEISCKSKTMCFDSSNAKSCESLSDGNKDLRLTINKKIAAALSYQEKADLNKFEALSISSGSDNGENSDNKSRVSDTSDKDMILE